MTAFRLLWMFSFRLVLLHSEFGKIVLSYMNQCG